MAECVASAFCVKLNTQRRPVGERGFSGRTTNLKTVQRKYSRSGCKFVHFSRWKTFELSVFGATDLKFTPRLQKFPLKCIDLGALVDFDGATASDLVPVVDQMLLMGSIFLTYMAGVIPVEKSYASYQKTNSDKNMFPESSDISGSSVKQNYGVDSKYVLNVVRGKLLNSLNALEHKAYSGDIILQSAKRPLSLSAVARDPKLRLLWAAFQQVEEEVNNISSISRAVGMDDLFGMFSENIQRSCHSICAVWLEKEFFLLKGNADEELTSMILEKVRGDSTIVQSITRSGKKDLYLELLWYLTFGSLREDCYYDLRIFAVHGISILEDLVIALADGVASIYLEFISVDSDVSSKTNSLDMSLCALSTRELQKLRNEVALNQWLYHNMDTVVSMYEDRFDLCILESQAIVLTHNIQTEKQNWWKKLTQQNSETMSPELHCIEISHFSMPVKRTKELRALTGWRYYFSLFLELSDITMPLVRAVIDKVSDAISFFLVSLIGRSLGLVYTGIRQSLRWK
ncbi:Ycf55 family protein [Spatholobus suberectus]|nr:Ycf55 family protein [Spatholobus suberectus]